MSARALPGRLVLLGHPVSHSLSPRFQQAALDHCGIPLRYEALDVSAAHVGKTVAALRKIGGAGNVTLPHKQQVHRLCDQRTPVADAAAAVNAFWVDGEGRLCGDNTDVGGFAAVAATLLEGRTSPLVLLLGAGGAALAVREALRQWPGARLIVQARREGVAEEFVAPLGDRGSALGQLPSDLDAALQQADLVVNATPLGLPGQDGLPLPVELLQPRNAVLDLTYRDDRVTPWVAACRRRGLRAEDGLGMLIEQGALAFERWFGIPAPRDVMRRAVGR